MNFDWETFVTALGLAFVLEGLPYFLFPDKMPKYLLAMAERSPKELRWLGSVAVMAGVLAVFVVRRG